MEYIFFLDETGDHGLKFVDENFPLFVLCGCLFCEDALYDIEAKMSQLKLKYFNTTEVIFHSRDIRKCEGAFQILFDLELKKAFYHDMNEVLGKADYRIIAAGINKGEHIKKYEKGFFNAGIKAIEKNTPTWLHVSCENWNSDNIIWINN